MATVSVNLDNDYHGEHEREIRSDDCRKNVTRKCDEKQFQCGNGACIPIRFLCDGDSDCLDHSDEMIETCKFLDREPKGKHLWHKGWLISLSRLIVAENRCGSRTTHDITTSIAQITMQTTRSINMD
ncbi:hypothetical protein GQX74_004853 [Glossina fuscipes]|nr:hypothetical protein GQX74_004853 [Glossina fuscipes]